MTDHAVWRLFRGTRVTGVTVRPDVNYRGMFRVHWPDTPGGRGPRALASDMVNLTRAKDAAMLWAGRSGGSASVSLKWKPPQRPSGASPMRVSRPG